MRHEICAECKKCFNYEVSELGCFGQSEICEYYTIHEED